MKHIFKIVLLIVAAATLTGCNKDKTIVVNSPPIAPYSLANEYESITFHYEGFGLGGWGTTELTVDLSTGSAVVNDSNAGFWECYAPSADMLEALETLALNVRVIDLSEGDPISCPAMMPLEYLLFTKPGGVSTPVTGCPFTLSSVDYTIAYDLLDLYADACSPL